MALRISGKHMDIGQALREHIATQVADAVGKVFDGAYEGHVVVEREGGGYRVDLQIALATGTTLQTHASAHDVYPSADQAIQRLSKRLRRYKTKLKSRHGGAGRQELEVPYQVLALPDESEDEDLPADFAPLVVAETTRRISTATVGEAVMDLDLSGAPVIVFRNAGTGAINVVYRRTDGNVGWIDPVLIERAG